MPHQNILNNYAIKNVQYMYESLCIAGKQYSLSMVVKDIQVSSLV